ncbi:DNA methyltransferase [Oryzihumus leptocrescens]|uniref:Methyltransferase n=1 Tax=Oryzihumus leptocrescens TaxID=297536 RepID=A0A542ZEQ5_9MICO|nr:DNA methyltransferase [Oryzihumus leptocrescens]TQL58769.1 site-specific DNA-methyltransferase (adenine-specific) [Oryzihumus leptocrescens]
MTVEPNGVVPADFDLDPLLPPLDEATYTALREDIRARGIIVPVEVTETGEVIDGRARLRAAQDLGITTYPRVIRSALTPDEQAAHRLALNTHRRHLTRAQRDAAVRALRLLGWSTRAISSATGVPQSTVARALRAVPSGVPAGSPDRVTGRDGRSHPARRPSVIAHTRHEQERAQAALATLGQTAPSKALDLRRAERLVREARASERRAQPSPWLPPDARVLQCDFRNLPVKPDTADLVFTDPPYTKAAMADVWPDLGRYAALWLKPGGLLIAYTGQMHLPEALDALRDSDLRYWWTMAAPHDTGSGMAQVRQRNVGCGWKPLLVFRKPGALGLPPWTTDITRGGSRSKDSGHPWEQPVAEAAHLIRDLVPPTGLVVDPFAGSGTTAVAAVSLGRRVITCDIDPDHTATARGRVADTLATMQGNPRDSPG